MLSALYVCVTSNNPFLLKMQENTLNFWQPIVYSLTAVNCDTVGFWFYPNDTNAEYELPRRSQVAYDYVQVCHTVPHQYSKLLLGKLIQ